MHPQTLFARGAARAAAALALILAGVADAPAARAPQEFDFTARLDGEPIGTHRFLVSPSGDGDIAVTSEARFDVSLLGIPLYRYRHRASERWVDGCLASIDARTDDNGRVTEVQGKAEAGLFDVRVRGEGGDAPAAPEASGCLMSFAYWNPALARQKRLIDPGSGRVEAVVVTPAPQLPADLGAQSAALRGFRIGGLPNPIDVWYLGDRWVGLDTVVSGGRHLSYRLR